MGARRVTEGKTLDYTPVSAVTAGDVIVIGKVVAVAECDIAAGAKGALAISGKFAFPKSTATGSSVGLDAGAKIYWDESEEIVSTSSSGNECAGYIEEAPADADETVNVVLARA